MEAMPWRRSAMLSVPLVLVLAVALPAPPGTAAEDLRGPAFSDPAAGQEMDKGWKETAVSPSSNHAGADIVVNLNQQFYEFMVGYIEDYGRETGLNIKVLRGTCGTTAGMLEKKETHVGAYCCPPGKTDRLPGLQFHTVGVHPISILVHPDNPVDDLSLEEVRNVFQGKTDRWAELGWAELPIQVVARLHCKKRPGHWRLMLDSAELFAPEATEVGAIEDMFSLVSTTPSAIGYEVMWMSSRMGDKVKTVKIDGRHPGDLEHLLNGRYPFYRALSLTTWERGDPTGSRSGKLTEYVIRKVEEHGIDEGIIPVSRLRAAGWSFHGDEVTGEPRRTEAQ